MEQSLLSAVSGIEADQTYLDVIGNNVANANTTAYKSENAEFEDLLAEQISGASAPLGDDEGAGIDPMDVGGGVSIGAVTEDLSQGTLEQTGVASDVAIQGNGYLVVKQDGSTYYTRNGELTLDDDGDLATSTGGLVQGWMANSDGTIDTDAPTGAVTISTEETMPASATTTVTLGGNLPADGTSTVTKTVEMYDDLGNTVPVTVTYTPGTTANTWDVSAEASGATTPLFSATVTFGSDGQVSGITDVSSGATYTAGTSTTPSTIAVTLSNASGGNMPTDSDFTAGSTLTFDFPETSSSSALTQYDGSSSVTATDDGYAAGSLSSYSIGSDGVITGSFNNGETLTIGQIALANFANPGGLSLDGDTLYSSTANSGQAQIGTPGSGGLGTLVGGSLENSNVDLASQLTGLIVAQESYSANTKVISTTSQNLQTLTEMA